jgi:hypothetical protein
MRFVDGAASLSEKFGRARATIGGRRVFDAGRCQRSGAGRYRRQGLFVIVCYCCLLLFVLFVDELWCDFGLVGANAVDVAASRQQCAFFGRDASKVFVAWNTTSSRVHDNNNHNTTLLFKVVFLNIDILPSRRQLQHAAAFSTTLKSTIQVLES